MCAFAALQCRILVFVHPMRGDDQSDRLCGATTPFLIKKRTPVSGAPRPAPACSFGRALRQNGNCTTLRTSRNRLRGPKVLACEFMGTSRRMRAGVMPSVGNRTKHVLR